MKPRAIRLSLPGIELAPIWDVKAKASEDRVRASVDCRMSPDE